MCCARLRRKVQKIPLVESQPKCRVFRDVDPEKVRTLGPFERLMDVFTTYPDVDNINAKLTSRKGRETGTKRDRDSEINWKIRNSQYPVIDWGEDDISLADLCHSDSKFRTFVQNAGIAKPNDQA